MTELDLRTDDPEEFQGRVVRLDGAEYEIGPLLGEGGERFVHELINRRFGRTTHAILILRDQENAADISTKARDALRQLRDRGLRHVIHDHVTVHAHGGVFELREGLDRTETEIRMAQLLDAQRYDEAEAIAESILATHPDNFLALLVLAAVHGRGDDAYRGLKPAMDALRIEPNTRACKVTAMRCAVAAGAFRTFWWQYEDMRAKWPNDHTMDDLAASVHVTVGTPEKAAGLELDHDVAELVRRESEAKRGADEVMRTSFTLEDTPEHNKRNHDILEQAYRIYPRAPNIAVNYGLVLLRIGDGRAAHDVLARIVPVLEPRLHGEFLGYMAFGLAVAGEWSEAYELLDHMTRVLGDNDIEPVNLPGWPVWWVERDHMMLYARTHRPFQLIAQVLGHVGPDRVRPEVRAMALLYARHPCNPD